MMTKAVNMKSVFLAILMALVLWEANVVARPDSRRDSGTHMVSHSHKGKRSWDAPLIPEAPEDPELKMLVEDDESDKGDAIAELPLENMWLDIKREFPVTRQLNRNSDGELECQAVGSPPPKVFWLKNGLPIESMTIVTNTEQLQNRIEMGNNVIFDKFGRTGMANVKSRLPLKCVRPEDEGHYTCVAVNRGKQTSATTYVTVIDDPNATRGSCEYRVSMFSYKKHKKGSAPVITNSESFHMETMGRHISLPCRAVGKPRAQITWFDQEGKKIVSGKKYQVSASGSLIIRNLVWKDMGVYTCSVENTHGKDSITTFVYPMVEETADES